MTDKGVEVHPPSVTKIVGETIDKSGPLQGWAVNQALEVVQKSIDPNCPIGESMFQVILDEARRAPRARKQEAANLGTEVHRILEAHAKGNDPFSLNVSIQAIERANAGIAWLHNIEAEPIAVERRVYSRKRGFVGTLDKLFLVQKRLTLLDWKNSKDIWPEHKLQSAAYCGAYEEETGEKIAQRCLVRLGEDGVIEPHWFNRTSYLRDYSGFLGLLRGFKRLQEIKGEKN